MHGYDIILQRRYFALEMFGGWISRIVGRNKTHGGEAYEPFERPPGEPFLYR